MQMKVLKTENHKLFIKSKLLDGYIIYG